MPVPDENERTIGDYLREVVDDPDRLVRYIYDDNARDDDIAGSGLNEFDQEILRRGKLDELCLALQAEDSAGALFHHIIRPIPPPPPPG
jgi:hypothetical protein